MRIVLSLSALSLLSVTPLPSDAGINQDESSMMKEERCRGYDGSLCVSMAMRGKQALSATTPHINLSSPIITLVGNARKYC